MLYQVTHATRYAYETAASQSVNELRVTPRSLVLQRVLQTAIIVEPNPGPLHQRKDYFGNDVTSFAIFEAHNRLETTASSLVDVQAIDLGAWKATSAPWEHVRDHIADAADGPALEASEFIFDSPFIVTSAELADYARPSFTPARPLFEAVEELCHRINTDFKYQPKSTTIDMPLAKVLSGRRGVCQDFAHVMIGALRSIRVAARYVSGYVRSEAAFQGAGASHAWVSVFIPEAGWLGFDPTNDLIPSDGHITLAWGRDYGDVTPVKGITLGGGSQITDVEVAVIEQQPPAAS